VAPDRLPESLDWTGRIPEPVSKGTDSEKNTLFPEDPMQVPFRSKAGVQDACAQSRGAAEVTQGHGVKTLGPAEGQCSLQNPLQIPDRNLFLLDSDLVAILPVKGSADVFPRGRLFPLKAIEF
jgi:hypothetical protein